MTIKFKAKLNLAEGRKWGGLGVANTVALLRPEQQGSMRSVAHVEKQSRPKRKTLPADFTWWITTLESFSTDLAALKYVLLKIIWDGYKSLDQVS